MRLFYQRLSGEEIHFDKADQEKEHDEERDCKRDACPVTPADFPEEGPLGGVAFQRNLERAAWKAGNGKVPVQLFEDYQKHKPSTRLKDVEPCIKGACVPGDVRSIFPKEIGDSIEEGVLAFGKKIKGFDRPDAVLSGVESRTSSPVRIVRDKDSLEANYEGIYPCGEGAGYAGGITSAAMDGIRVAEQIASQFAPLQR